MQYMPATWRAHSMQVYGKVLEKTPEREWYVAVRMIQKWLDEGYSEAQIALIWNQGNPGECHAGTNSKGVPFNSCDYRDKILALL